MGLRWNTLVGDLREILNIVPQFISPEVISQQRLAFSYLPWWLWKQQLRLSTVDIDGWECHYDIEGMMINKETVFLDISYSLCYNVNSY